MRIMWDIKGFTFIKPEDDLWWQNKPYFNQVLDILEKNNHLEGIRFIEINDVYTKVDSVDDIKEIVRSTDGSYVLFKLVEAMDSTNAINIDLTDEEIYVQVIINANEDSLPSLISQMIKTTAEAYLKLRDVVIMGPSTYVSFYYFNFPRYRPERKINFGISDSIVDFIDPNFYENEYYTQLKMNDMDKLYTEPLPPGCFREKVGDLYIFTWVNQFDKETIIRSLMQREEWLYKVLSPPVSPHFTEQGDRQEINILPNPHKVNTFFTAYNDCMHIGFKAITLTPDNDFDPEIKRQLIHYVQEKKLENGDPLKRIYLILPTRERAVAIQEKAREIGITNIFYIGKDKFFCDICPKGNWRN